MLCPRPETRDDRFAIVPAYQRLCTAPTAMAGPRRLRIAVKNELTLPPCLPGPFDFQATVRLANKNRIASAVYFLPAPVSRVHIFMPETSWRLPIVIAINSLEWRMYPLYSELTPLYLNCRAFELKFCDVPRVYIISLGLDRPT